ncbi:MAG TPA: HAD family phosphatase [Candidatus Saccharimonadia bacterium]|jgi:putative hydrolase of the HAD superfamily
MIKALIFDFFDVIRTDAYKAWLASNKIPHEGPYFDASHQQDIGAITTEQFLTTLSELTGREVTFEEVDGAATVDNAVVNIVSKLSKEYKMALISNAPSKLIRGILAENNLEQYFDVIVVSSEVGMVKPSPEIFHLALKKLHVAPAESVFIDDNIRHVEAAANIGINSTQFKSAEQLKTDLTQLGVTI